MLANADIFESSVDRIRQAYKDFNYSFGWRFLYTSQQTLNNPRLAFMGLNPGAGNPENLSKYPLEYPSVEDGNAYRIENWGDHPGTFNPLQKQVQLMFGLIAERLGADCNALMDETVTSNFCPFRSSSYETEKEKELVTRFCYDFWRDICASLIPRVMICLGNDAFDPFCNIYQELGFNRSGLVGSIPSGWGQTSYGMLGLQKESISITLFSVPHLSWHKLFGSDKSKRIEASRSFISLVAACLVNKMPAIEAATP